MVLFPNHHEVPPGRCLAAQVLEIYDDEDLLKLKSQHKLLQALTNYERNEPCSWRDPLVVSAAAMTWERRRMEMIRSIFDEVVCFFGVS